MKKQIIKAIEIEKIAEFELSKPENINAVTIALANSGYFIKIRSNDKLSKTVEIYTDRNYIL